MAKPKAKVVVVPFFDGTEDAAEVFKRIITMQVEQELKSKTDEQMYTVNKNNSDEETA